jgi:hypothetical protein
MAMKTWASKIKRTLKEEEEKGRRKIRYYITTSTFKKTIAILFVKNNIILY